MIAEGRPRLPGAGLGGRAERGGVRAGRGGLWRKPEAGGASRKSSGSVGRVGKGLGRQPGLEWFGRWEWVGLGRRRLGWLAAAGSRGDRPGRG